MFLRSVTAEIDLVCLGLVWFYCTSTIIGNLMPNPFYAYILDLGFLNTFCR